MKKINKKNLITFIFAIFLGLMIVCCIQLMIAFYTNNFATKHALAKIEEQAEKNSAENQNTEKVDFKKQEEIYKKALEDSNCQDSKALQNLADLYLKEKKPADAVNLVENYCKYMPRRKTLRVKRKFYENYADYLCSQKEYLAGIEAYKKAVSFQKSYRPKLSVKKLHEKILQSYINQAQLYKEKDQPDDAINSLNHALNYQKSAGNVYNELAILYFDKDLKEAVRYFEMAKKYNPYAVNYHLYLNALAQIKRHTPNEAELNLYKLKEDNLQHYINNFITNPGEFRVLFYEPKIRPKLLSKEKKVTIVFKLENRNNFIVNNLELKTEISNGEKIITTKKCTLIKPAEHLAPDALSNDVKISLTIPKKQKNLVCNLYATKNSKVPMQPIFIQNITLEK